MPLTLIIGGGWSAIAAAITSAEHGATVLVVEERGYLGGRARSFVDRASGDEIDNGQHVMMGCYRDFIGILTTLGTLGLLERQSALRVAFVDATGLHDVLDASSLPGRMGIVLGLLQLKGIRLKSRLAAVRLAAAISLGWASGKGLSCAEFLNKHHQPSDVIERFWEPVVLATINATLHLASAELLVEVMKLAFLGSRTDSQLMIPTAGLSALIEPFPAWLQRSGGSVRTSVSVDKLVVDASAVRWAYLSDGTVVDVDAVISCVPQRALERLLEASNITSSLPPEPPSSPIVSVYLWYSSPWMPYDFSAALGTTIQWVFDKRRVQSGLVALTVSSGTSLVSEHVDTVIEKCDQELRTLFPELTGVRLLRGVVLKEKQATPLLMPTNVSSRPETRALESVATNLLIAGDWTQTRLPATLEGAVRSGISAANALRRK